MHVAALRFDLHLPSCRSLKAKRAIIRPILDGARTRYRVASSETGYQDQWQRSALGFAAVSSSPAHLAEMLDDVERFVWSHPEIEVASATRHWLEVDADA